jgi:hypothetical protein
VLIAAGRARVKPCVCGRESCRRCHFERTVSRAGIDDYRAIDDCFDRLQAARQVTLPF